MFHVYEVLPVVVQIDLGLRKDFSIGKTSLQASVDIFNVLNDPTLMIQEFRNEQLVGIRNTGRQYQVGSKLAF